VVAGKQTRLQLTDPVVAGKQTRLQLTNPVVAGKQTRLQLTNQVVAEKQTMPTIHVPSWLACQADAGCTATSTSYFPS
jgi:hypothetical protein